MRIYSKGARLPGAGYSFAIDKIMTNKTKGDYAYALLDVDSPVTDEVIEKLATTEGVLRVRKVK